MSDLTHLKPRLEQLPFPELDAVRRLVEMTQAELCREAGFNTNTYTKWRKWARGEEGGASPQGRSIKAIAGVLRARIDKMEADPLRIAS